MISLTSIKSSHTDKKQIEEQVEPKKEDEFNSETETKIEKEIRVVAPAMKIASIAEVEKKEATIEAKNRDSGNDIQSDSLNWEVVLSPVDTKLVEKESKKLKNQIKNDLKNNDKKEKSEKKEVEVDNNMFENYKPKYWKKENVEKDVAWNAAPKFKKHLSAKKRNMIIAGLILFVLWISAGWYMFFNNSGSGTDGIQAIAVENNIVQTKENVENIINNETENEENEEILEETIIANGDSNSEIEQEWEENIEAEIEDINNESTEEETVENNDEESIEDAENGEIAQVETSWESKVKNYLLDNYYK